MPDTPPAEETGVLESIQETHLGRWSPRRLGIPALFDWWPSYVVVAGGAALVVLATLRMAFDVVHPLAHVLVVLTFAAALTFALLPVVDRLAVALRSRSLAVLAIAAFFLVAIAVLGSAVAAGVAAEGGRLARAITEYEEAARGLRPLEIGGRPLSPEIAQQVRRFAEANGPALASLSSSLVFAVAATIVDAFLVLVLTVYLLLDARRGRLLFLRALAPAHRAAARRMTSEIARVFGAYLRAQLVLAVSVALSVTVLLAVLGVPYAVLIGVFAGIVELVPMIGPIIGAVPALLSALTQPFPTVLWVAIGFLLIQQIESNVLMPRLLGGAIGLHPVAAVLALLAGFGVGGPVGALIAVPVVGLVWVFLSTAVLAWRGKRIEVAQRHRRPWRSRYRARPRAAHTVPEPKA
ncbi:MAG TPA: AI-2E family transporter [Candidatus Limnocylindria bacterium]|nr:AI-2E family transporter [Candidatus Limnocylindria bacterium]